MAAEKLPYPPVALFITAANARRSTPGLRHPA